MRSYGEAPPLMQLQRDAQRAALIGVGAALQLLEQSLPALGPWFKPGLANLATLIALATGGAKEAAIVAAGRILLGGWFSGGWLAPTFFISAAAGFAAWCAMAAAARLPGVSLIGISLAGAGMHIAGQIAVVDAFFAGGANLWPLLPWLWPPALIAGWINGALARYILDRWPCWNTIIG